MGVTNPIDATVGAWADRTFPDQTDDRLVRHLREEVEELDRACEQLEGIGEAIADCLILLYALAYRHNIDPDAAVRRKHEVNEARVWAFDPTYGYDKKVS